MVKQWFLVVLYAAIALLAIGLMFQPVTIHEKVGLTHEEEIFYSQSAVSFQGLDLRADAWKEYPSYNIGLGIIAAMSLGGMILSVVVIDKQGGVDEG